MGQLFSANSSGVMDAIYRSRLNFFSICFLGWLFFSLFSLGFSFLFFAWDEWEGIVRPYWVEPSGGGVSLLHKMGFAVRSVRVAQGFIQSYLENL